MQGDNEQNWAKWEERFAQFLDEEVGQEAAHGRDHIHRVVANARKLAALEGARLEVVVPAAWLHDCVIVLKNSDQRHLASRMAAERAAVFLTESGYPVDEIPAIEHAIAAHSFTAQISPETVEAQVVQDADRLDALGAVGIARCFAVGGFMGTELYNLEEPFPVTRQADDKQYSVDHFFLKLLNLSGTMNTGAGRQEAERRTAFMQRYLEQLQNEIERGV